MSDASGDVVDVSPNEVRTKLWQDLHEKANTPWHSEHIHP